MKVVNYGSSYEIYSDDLKTYDKLPVGTYGVKFNPMSGFSLTKRDNFVNNEEKIYGARTGKVTKVLRTFNDLERSTGVILSGAKGIGKSLFTQLLSIEGINQGLPVIVVEKAYKGIAKFIDSIDQEAVIMFDEFEKTFDKSKENIESQDDLLGLFDGVSQRKRLYVITVNDLNKVNSFMLNRPGRFHYHIRFGYPSASEIEIYLGDKVPAEYKSEISKVVAFSQRVNLNYDCLRAIAYELSNGESFEEAIKDLNILNTDSKEYTITTTFKNGKRHQSSRSVDMFSDETHTYCSLIGTDGDGDEHQQVMFKVLFNPKEAMLLKGVLTITEFSEIEFVHGGSVEGVEEVSDIESMTFTPKGDREYHYAV